MQLLNKYTVFCSSMLFQPDFPLSYSTLCVFMIVIFCIFALYLIQIRKKIKHKFRNKCTLVRYENKKQDFKKGWKLFKKAEHWYNECVWWNLKIMLPKILWIFADWKSWSKLIIIYRKAYPCTYIILNFFLKWQETVFIYRLCHLNYQ